MKRLGISAAVTGAVWVVVHYKKDDIPHLDQIIVGQIGVIFGIAALVMLLGTPKWSARSLGILYTSLATFVLYAMGWTYYGTIRNDPIPVWLIDMARSLFIVGGPMLAYGLLMWVHANWGPPSKPDYEPYTGRERRQSQRRAADRERDDLLQKYQRGEVT